MSPLPSAAAMRRRRRSGGGERGSRPGVFDRRKPIGYNAFDKDLQLWVGAILYKGTVDV